MMPSLHFLIVQGPHRLRGGLLRLASIITSIKRSYQVEKRRYRFIECTDTEASNAATNAALLRECGAFSEALDFLGFPVTYNTAASMAACWSFICRLNHPYSVGPPVKRIH